MHNLSIVSFAFFVLSALLCMFAIPIDELTHFYVSPPIGQKNLTDDGWEKGSEDLIALRSNNSGAESNRGERVEVGWIKSNWVLLTKYFQLDRKKMFANWSLSDCKAARQLRLLTWIVFILLFSSIVDSPNEAYFLLLYTGKSDLEDGWESWKIEFMAC